MKYQIRTFITIILCLVVITSNGQNINGIYRTGYIRSLEDNQTIEKPSSDSIQYIDANENYLLVNGIVEIKNREIKFFSFSDGIKTVKMEPDQSFTIFDTKLNLAHNSKDSIVFQVNNSPQNYFVWYPFIPTKEKTKIKRANLTNSYWQLDSKNEWLDGIKIQFLENDEVILNYPHKEYTYTTYTNSGKWKVYRSGKYSIIYIRDEHKMSEYFLLIKKSREKKIEAILTEEIAFYPPFSDEIDLKRLKFTSDSDLQDISKDISGSWELTHIYDPYFGPQEFTNDSLRNIEGTLVLNPQGAYQLKLNGSANLDDEIIVFNMNELGKWELGRTGDYLNIRRENGWQKLVTIERLEKDELIVHLRLTISHRGLSKKMKFKSLGK